MKRKLIIIAEHFSTGGMPAIVVTELAPLEDYECHVLILSDSGYYVHVDAIKKMKHACIRIFQGDRDGLVKHALELEPAFVVQHGTDLGRVDFQKANIRCIEMVHSDNPRFLNIGNAPEADLYLAVSPTVTETLRALGVCGEIREVRTPIDQSVFNQKSIERASIRKQLGLTESNIVLLNVGVWSPHKNQGGAITIFRQLRERHEWVKLLLVGALAQNFESYWRPITDQVQDDPDIKIVGETHNPENYYTAADIYLHTSHAEGCCVAIREAAMMGLPCVINQIPSNKKTFPCPPFRFASTDWNGISFVDELSELVCEPKIRDDLGKASRAWVEKRYNVSQYLVQMRGIYDEFESGRIKGPGKRMLESQEYELSYRDGGVKLTVTGHGCDRAMVLGLRVLLPSEGAYWEREVACSPGDKPWIHYYGKPWFVPYHSQIVEDGKVVREERLQLDGKHVYIKYDSRGLGDTLAWLEAVIAFQKVHHCRVSVFTFHNEFLRKVLNRADISFVDQQPDDFDIMYTLGCYEGFDRAKTNWRTMNLWDIGKDCLGLQRIEPLVLNVDGEQPLSIPYVCISEHASTRNKMWNRPGGWQVVVDGLREMEYEVCVISKETTTLTGIADWTGDMSLYDRAIQLKHAAFFVGMASGLGVLANAVGTHVFWMPTSCYDWHVQHDGMTVISRNDVCRGCWNRLEFGLDKGHDWCPAELDFQCSRYLEPQYVLNIIDGVV